MDAGVVLPSLGGSSGVGVIASLEEPPWLTGAGSLVAPVPPAPPLLGTGFTGAGRGLSGGGSSEGLEPAGAPQAAALARPASAASSGRVDLKR
jgi:hypothetical protein